MGLNQEIDTEGGQPLGEYDDTAIQSGAADGEAVNPAPDLPRPELSLDTLYGDVRDALLSRFRTTRKPWEQMTEDEQRMLVEAFGMTAREVVQQSVKLLTKYDWPRAVVKMGKVVIKDKETIEATIVAPNHEDYRTVLGDNVGGYVMLLAVDSETFMASRQEPQIDPDQPAFDLGAQGEAE